jgi:hypothetical protein
MAQLKQKVDSGYSLKSVIEEQVDKVKTLGPYQRKTLEWLRETDESTGKMRYETEINGTCKKTAEYMAQRRFDSIYTINVHWFGVHFDINDLGIISGFFIIIFMLMLLYNFGLRYSNLLKLFNVLDSLSDKYAKRIFFDLSTFSIILKLPKRSTTETSSFILNLIPYLLFTIPTLVYLYLFITDYNSMEIVQALYPKIKAVIIIEGIILALIVIMTISIFKIDYATDELWDEFESKLTSKSNEPANGTNA